MLQPISLREACRFVADHHRHHRAPQGGLFAIALSENEQVIGVAIVGRPVSRILDDGWTAEVTRVAVREGFRNACSRLYGAAKRAAQAHGYRRVLTYTLASESGSSLKGAGWARVGFAGGGTWNRKNRPRVDTAPIEQKVLWETSLVRVSGRIVPGLDTPTA